MPKTKARPKKKPQAKPQGDAIDDVEIRGVVSTTDIRPSPTNPRKTFNEAKLRELADSFGRLGILQPLVVRPYPLDAASPEETDYYELIAGERRWRAAKLAGIPRVPVTIRRLTDDQVRDAQLIENDQREDVLPSEQARAYQQVRDDGKTVEQIAAKVGKPVSYVRSVLVLARLPSSFLDAVDAGRVPRSVAELVARVPGDDSRRLVAACVLAGQGYLSADRKPPKPAKDAVPLSFRDTRDLIARHFQVELKSAPFNRKSLDLVEGAPSCDACPKRAGNAAKEDFAYAEVRADVCLDPVCFKAKADAHQKRIAAAERAARKANPPVKEHREPDTAAASITADATDKSSPQSDTAGHESKLVDAIRRRLQEEAASYAGRPVDDWTPEKYDAALKAVLVAVMEWAPVRAMDYVAKRRGWDSEWNVDIVSQSLSPEAIFGVIAEACVVDWLQSTDMAHSPLLEGLCIDFSHIREEAESEVRAHAPTTNEEGGERG